MRTPPRSKQIVADTIADAIERSHRAEIARLTAALQRLADGAAQLSQSHADVLAICAEVGVTPSIGGEHDDHV